MYSLIIVDDETELLEGMSQYFPWETIGFRVLETFSDARSVLTYCKDHKADVILTDIHMPFIDGLELIRQLKKLEAASYFCIMSAYSDFEYAKQAIHLNVQEYLLKPAGFDEITEAFNKIRKALDGSTIKSEELSVSVSGNPLIARTMALIEKRLDSCSLQNIAVELGVTDSYLSRLFKIETGKKFQVYLQDQKMEVARQMLNSKLHYKNKEIAKALGYQDTQNFCRTFRNYWGNSPQKFRKESFE